MDARTLARLAAQYAARASPASGSPTTSGAAGRGLRAGLQDRRAGRAAARPARRRAGRPGERQGRLDAAARRTGLGTASASVEDPRLSSGSPPAGVTCEVCPSSNVALGVAPDEAAVPLSDAVRGRACPWRSAPTTRCCSARAWSSSTRSPGTCTASRRRAGRAGPHVGAGLRRPARHEGPPAAPIDAWLTPPEPAASPATTRPKGCEGAAHAVRRNRGAHPPARG